MEIKLTQQEMHYISTVEPITGTPIIDCIERENRITFIVEKGSSGRPLESRHET